MRIKSNENEWVGGGREKWEVERGKESRETGYRKPDVCRNVSHN